MISDQFMSNLTTGIRQKMKTWVNSAVVSESKHLCKIIGENAEEEFFLLQDNKNDCDLI